MVTRPLATAVGLLVDAALGEPPGRPHPVAAFGQVMRAVEGRVYRDSRGRIVRRDDRGVWRDRKGRVYDRRGRVYDRRRNGRDSDSDSDSD